MRFFSLSWDMTEELTCADTTAAKGRRRRVDGFILFDGSGECEKSILNVCEKICGPVLAGDERNCEQTRLLGKMNRIQGYHEKKKTKQNKGAKKIIRKFGL